MRRCLDRAFVLHSMPYRESSAIVRVLSAENGLISGVVRGVYQHNRKAQQLRASLQLGSHLEWQWQGDGGLKNMLHCDLLAQAAIRDAGQLLCLSYINELLLHFLPADQPAPALYGAYALLLDDIIHRPDTEPVLRDYEQLLFEEMGCAIDFLWDNTHDQPVQENTLYCINPEHGVRLDDGMQQGLPLRGSQLLLLAEKDFSKPETRRLNKRVNRLIIDHHLAGRPLKARALYRQLSL